jgi:hypothetical protein
MWEDSQFFWRGGDSQIQQVSVEYCSCIQYFVPVPRVLRFVPTGTTGNLLAEGNMQNLQNLQEIELVRAFRMLDQRKKLIAVSYLKKEAKQAAQHQPLLRVVGGSGFGGGGKTD